MDTYSISAKYYDDEYASKSDLNDLPFYLEAAKRFGGPILEVACGTGRILLPTARQGHEIHGIDRSSPMLNVLKTHLKGEAQEVQKRITLHEGDMRTFKLDKKFKLITIPFRPMQHMYQLEDQLAALKNISAHLDKGGVLVFDVFFPKLDMVGTGIGQEIWELEWTSRENPKQTVKRVFRKETFNKVHQFFTAKFIFRTFEGDTLVKTEEEDFKMGFYTYPQLRALFQLAGLTVREEYGSFEKTPMDDSAKEMIFVLERA